MPVRRIWQNDAATLEFNRLVREARGIKYGITGISVALRVHGLSRNWLRDKDFGRSQVRPQDLSTLRAVLETAAAAASGDSGIRIRMTEVKNSAEKRARQHEVYEVRRLISAFCRQCSGERCMDACCVLRPISPLPIHPDAARNEPSSGLED